MGTRADFYVGRGENAEWIGSIAWDGYPSGISTTILETTTEEAYRAAVESFFVGRNDVTRPAQGWPWPWEDSRTTDYAYAFDEGRVFASGFGAPWFIAIEEEPDRPDGRTTVFPKFACGQPSAAAGSRRSGIMVFGIK